MLDFLKVSNLALIDGLSVEFGEGFTCVTGETGAGKSVILGALSMLSGSRCGKEVVGPHSDSCKVEASISFADPSRVDSFLEENGVALCEDGVLVVSRSISRSKSGRVFINGTLVPLSVLSGLGGLWIDFHGPREPQKLFSQKNQLKMLDARCPDAEAFENYAELYGEYKAVAKRRKELSQAKELTRDEVEFLKAQIAAIDSMKISEESIGRLEEQYKMAEMAGEILEKASAVVGMLGGSGDSVLERLRACNRLAADLARAGGSAVTLCERLASAVIEIDDISSEFAALAESSDLRPGELEALREKMSAWLGMARKYGAAPSMVLAARDEMAGRIENQTDIKRSLERLKERESELAALMQPLAGRIFKARAGAAEALSGEVRKLLKRLGFKHADFRISVAAESVVSENFGSCCEFVFSANAGQAPGPLAKIASSGELARVMLALKTVLAEADDTPVLVFDEVDANVGGEVGAEVGAQLAHLAGRHQVFCITHLPQVASQAQNHFLVEKIQKKDSTKVVLKDISGDSKARVCELARMLGDRNSESALAHAEGLLKNGVFVNFKDGSKKQKKI